MSIKIKELLFFNNKEFNKVKKRNNKAPQQITVPINHSYGNVLKSHETNPSTVPFSVSRNNIAQERQKLLQPIETDEYNFIITEIFNYKMLPEDINNAAQYYLSSDGYQKTDKDFLGLIPYCGTHDKSVEINKWLSGRMTKLRSDILPDKNMANIIKALDYSIDKLDEKYGKHKGVVYRSGFFNPITDKQYYSASDSMICAIKHGLFNPPSEIYPYSIIKVKNGHKIYKFQEDSDSEISRRFARHEREILIDRKSRFRLVPEKEYTQEDIELKSDFLSLFDDCANGTCPVGKDSLPYKYATIWQEI